MLLFTYDFFFFFLFHFYYYYFFFSLFIYHLYCRSTWIDIITYMNIFFISQIIVIINVGWCLMCNIVSLTIFIFLLFLFPHVFIKLSDAWHAFSYLLFFTIYCCYYFFYLLFYLSHANMNSWHAFFFLLFTYVEVLSFIVFFFFLASIIFFLACHHEHESMVVSNVFLSINICFFCFCLFHFVLLSLGKLMIRKT